MTEMLQTHVIVYRKLLNLR